MATVNEPFGGAGRTEMIENPRGSGDPDTMIVDRDLNRIFAANVRRPPPPLSKKQQLEVKKEFRGTPQRGHGLTVVMALAVAVGLFGLCVWTLLDKVQDVSSGEPAGSGAPIAAVAYNNSPPPNAGSAPAATSDTSIQSASVTTSFAPGPTGPLLSARASLTPTVVALPPAPVALPAPRPPVYAKASATVAPSPAAAPPPRVAIVPAPIRAPMLTAAQPPAAPARTPVPLPKPSPQMAFNKVSPPRSVSGSVSPTADAMMRALAAQPLKSPTIAEHGKASTMESGASTPTATDSRACESATSCGSYGLVQAADTRLSRAFAAAAEAGVSQQLLGDVKGRWTGLRSDTSRRPSELLADYGSLTKSLWRARDLAVGSQRVPGDHSSSDPARAVSSQ